MVVVNVAEEVLSGVLQAAEQLQGSFLAAETSAVECLRWAGAMPLLLRDLGVQNVLQAQDLLQCRTPSEIRRLLLLGEEQSAAHVALMVSGFLWDYEADLQRLLALGVIRRLTICSSLSERAHECYDFSRGNGDTTVAPGARATKTMKFDDFATDLEKSMTFPVEKNTRESVKQVEVNKEAAMGNGNGEDEDWGWTEDEEGSRSPRKEVVTQNGATAGVQVLHLPLNVVPLLSSKKLTPEPSVFVLSHPTCAAAFPLLLHQVDDVVMASPASPTGRARAGSGDAVKKYAHVKDVLPGHIPSAFRRSMRLLAYTLAEMMVGARLDVKERIFALGATSLKIGHTLLRILNELDEDATTQSLQGKQERQLQLRKQGGREWIIPEVADAVQRQSSAGEEVLSLQELLTLLVHAFALSSGAPLEDFTIQMIEKVLTDKILQTATTDSPSLQAALPELFDQLAPYISTTGSHVSTSDAAVEAHDGDDWGWNDGSTSPNASKKTHAPTHNGGFQLTEAKSIIEAQTESLIGPLKDCAQQFVEISDDKFTSTGEESPRSLVAKLCRSIVNPSGSPISELEHIVDASEQLTRAGIDLLKSGFSKFGFGGGSGGGQRGTNVNRLLGESNVLMVFVVGGITFEEIQEVHDALSDNSKYQIILGGTTITNNEVILTKLFG
ncbi:hypothetical protein PHYBOEH_006132 [Phytophthora boehmeriae]|uniref:Sec1 family domain-containing protein 2 n=1 Tax=Phytophthora boehmeriae TaxID=109152 RepID=A0A8T1WMV4_9STRA|nr:hypothetical protein PHYBOEH_006132 [Phytophthora boehmeriae]